MFVREAGCGNFPLASSPLPSSNTDPHAAACRWGPAGLKPVYCPRDEPLVSIGYRVENSVQSFPGCPTLYGLQALERVLHGRPGDGSGTEARQTERQTGTLNVSAELQRLSVRPRCTCKEGRIVWCWRRGWCGSRWCGSRWCGSRSVWL